MFQGYLFAEPMSAAALAENMVNFHEPIGLLREAKEGALS